MESNKLERTRNAQLLGVCSGIGEYLEIDPTVIRIAFVMMFLFIGGGLLIYLILALIMPIAKKESTEKTPEKTLN